jgi:hypothetical protein
MLNLLATKFPSTLTVIAMFVVLFIGATPAVASAAGNKTPSGGQQAQDYCGKKYNNDKDKKAVCIIGFKGGYDKGNKNPCLSYSGAKEDACRNGYSKGSDARDKDDDCNKKDCNNPGSDPTAACTADNCDLIKKYLNPTINVLTVMFGLIAAGSIIMGGIQFSTSEGDPQKAARAKDRIASTIFAIFAYAFLYAFLQFLIPGGLFNR